MLLKKILFQTKNNFQVALSSVGVLIGMSALLLSVLLLNNIKTFQNSDEELFGANSLIIQKRVTKFTTIGMNSTEFTDEDITSLKQKEFIEKVAAFRSANYAVGISDYPGDGLPSFYADMFFQSIPDEFIDVETDWHWDESSEFVPIILPRDFLMLVNYGIAESQGMPQISEDLLAAARLQINMSGKNKRGKLVGKVVGFSHKISSILVPESFLNYSNDLYGSGQEKMAQRLFITIKDGSYGELEDLMDEMNLDINKTALDMTKIKTFVKVIISLFLMFSVIIVLLSIFSFIQYVQLILNKSKENIIILLRQGYKQKTIIMVLVKYFSLVFGTITVMSIIGVLVLKKTLVNKMLENNGVLVDTNEIVLSLFMGIICVILFILINFASTKVTLNKMSK